MSSIPTITELQRWEDLSTIRAAVKARLPDKSAAAIGLADIAELCKRDLKTRPARDCHDVRDQIFTDRDRVGLGSRCARPAVECLLTRRRDFPALRMRGLPYSAKRVDSAPAATNNPANCDEANTQAF